MKLYLITGHGTQQGRSVIDIALQAVAGGVDLVQLREKNMPDEEMILLARKLHDHLKPSGIPLIINDRVNIAQAINAEGVHLGPSDISCSEARAILGPDKIIGITCHNLQQVLDANSLDVDYISLSPVFSSPSLPNPLTPLGIDSLRQACRLSRHKIVAIGGINASNIRDVRDAGADSAALLSAIVEPANPMKAASVLKFLINN